MRNAVLLSRLTLVIVYSNPLHTFSHSHENVECLSFHPRECNHAGIVVASEIFITAPDGYGLEAPITFLRTNSAAVLTSQQAHVNYAALWSILVDHLYA